MFEMMLMRGGFNTYMGKIGLYNLNYVAGPTTDELYLFGGITEDEQQNDGLWLWNGKTDTYTNLGLVPTTVHKGGGGSVGTVGGDLYCISGGTIDVYRSGTKRWEKRLAPGYGSPYNFMSNSSVTYGGYMYFFGPSTDPEGITLKRYDHVTNGWTTESTYKTTTNAGSYTRGVVIGNLAYFMGANALNTTVMKYNFTSKVWTTITSSVAIHVRPALSVYAGKILITPVDEQGQPLYSSTGKRIMMLDPVTDTFTQIAETNPPKLTAATVVVGNQLKAFGGQDKATGKPVATVQSITVGPPTDDYSPIPIIKSTDITVSTIPLRNFRYSIDEAKGKIWINRGTAASGNSTWIGYFDVTINQWVGMYNWTASPISSTQTFVDNKVYFFSDAKIWKYDTIANTVVAVAATTGYAFGPYIAPAFTYKGEVYQIGPTYSGSYVYEVVKYDPITNVRTFISKSGPVSSNGDMSAILVGDWICVCGANGSAPAPKRVYCYNLVTSVWREIALRVDINANPTLVTDGKTFSILGGVGTSNRLGDVWVVDPNTGYSWAAGSLVPIKRNGAAILTGENVAFFGGETQSMPSLSPTVITFKYPTSG